MIPIVTPVEMAAIDAAAADPVGELIERAGAAVARAAVALMGGTYGRRVVTLVGPGNNGADGRSCARRLEQRGVKVTVVDVAAEPSLLPVADLYIDAAFGTGLGRAFVAPRRTSPSAPVLAVDITSGVDGLTGRVVGDGRVWPADLTVTFAALKPGLVHEPGRSLAGAVQVADIGLAVANPTTQLVEIEDVDAWIPKRGPTAHKWSSACRVIGGRRGMTGAASLASGAALRAGAGYVQLLRPGVEADESGPVEAVRIDVGSTDWSARAGADIDRIAALLIGPGLGAGDETGAAVSRVLSQAPVPMVVDADAISPAATDAMRGRSEPTIVTPHDGELARLGGDPSEPDRIGATLDVATALNTIVVRKGPSTIVAEPGGRVRVITAADQRMATAGTGDVLAGIIVGVLAAGAEPFDAAAGGAFLHAVAGRRGPSEGLTAGGLLELIPGALREIRAAA